MSDHLPRKEAIPQNASTPRIRLGDYLVSKGLLRTDQLNAALAEQRITQEKLGTILSRSGFVTRKDIIDAILATDPSRIHGEELHSARVPPDILLRFQVMVVAETDKQVFVSTMRSERQVAVELKDFYPDLELVFVASNHEHINTYLDKVKAMESSDESLFERLMRKAMRDNVSDVHIVPRYSSYTVFFRRLGVRHHAHEGSLDEYNTLSARIKDLARMDLAERRIPQDGAISFEGDGKLIDLRVATIPVGTAEYIVLRILDSDRVQPSLDTVGITRLAEWRKGVSRPNGLCLICGPTGSGKTTSLNASVKEMDRFSRAIFTMEDPVEYRIPYLGQVGANPAVGLDFARGIRAFMRLDPDVVIIGEVRDAETARNAVKAADTGHLVIATLHTSTIYGAVSRLRDLGVPPHELRYLLRSVMVQNLMRTWCSHCHGKGCIVCNGTGFTGRTVISECAYFSSEKEVGRLLEGETWWPSLLDDAILKHRQGMTSADEVIRIFGAEAAEALGRSEF